MKVCYFVMKDNELVEVGELKLMKENVKNQSCCYQFEKNFNYGKIENALTGVKYAHPLNIKRIVAFTMI